MLKGFVERRVGRRVTRQEPIQIRFEKEGQQNISAVTTNISAGGIQFYMPWIPDFVQQGEKVQLFFDIPNAGVEQAEGEIRHSRLAINDNMERIIYCGIKFLDIDPEIWRYIQHHYVTEAEPVEVERKKVSPFVDRREHARIETMIFANIAQMGKSVDALIEDISFDGVKVRVPVMVPLDSKVTIESFDQELPFRLDGVCVWVQKMNDSKDFYCGICFTNPNLEQFNQIRSLILKLVNSMDQSKLKL